MLIIINCKGKAERKRKDRQYQHSKEQGRKGSVQVGGSRGSMGRVL